MLRSCYSTDARFYNGDALVEDLEWFFVPHGTPFLTVPSVINTLNYLDKTERVDNPSFAGEVAGAARRYTKGSYNIAYTGLSAHGSAVDFAGNGTRPAAIANPSFGIAAVCGPPELEPILAGKYPVPGLFTRSDGGFTVLVANQKSSTWGFDDLQFGLNTWISNYPLWQLDLWNTNPNPSGTNDFLTDFNLLTYTGYGPQVPGPQAIAPNLANTAQEYSAPGIHFEQTGANAPGAIVGANGLVISDSAGFVLAWYQWSPTLFFHNVGDFLDFTLFVDAAPWDYP